LLVARSLLPFVAKPSKMVLCQKAFRRKGAAKRRRQRTKIWLYH
jgi:hypothetical protein